MISTTAACGWLPRAPYLGGPLDGSAAPPLRRKAETVHPTYRTAEGKAVRGEVSPDESHYAQRDYDVINGIHDTGGTTCGWPPAHLRSTPAPSAGSDYYCAPLAAPAANAADWPLRPDHHHR